MSTTPKLADQYADIAQRLKEIEAEKMKAINESKLPEVEEAPTGWWSVMKDAVVPEDDLWS